MVVEDCREIEPAPADDLEVGEVGLPQLVRRGGLVPELLGGLDHDEGRAGDQVMRALSKRWIAANLKAAALCKPLSRESGAVQVSGRLSAGRARSADLLFGHQREL
jgi:hypothetical protein